jgi:hypothetical protein
VDRRTKDLLTVLLCHSQTAKAVAGWDDWVALPHSAAQLDPTRAKTGVGAALEAAFDQSAAEWLALGRDLGCDKSASLAHTPACVTNASDTGQMMAWGRLVSAWAAEPSTTLVICDDPWMHRYLRDQPNVTTTGVPALWPQVASLAVRGVLARLKAAARAALLSLTMRRNHNTADDGAAWLLVYAHPRSTRQGDDAYFGDSLLRYPGLRRVMHVDGGWSAIRRLVGGAGRSASLHGWGSAWFAITLPFAFWRPRREVRRGRFGWLVRRAAMREAGTAQAAAIAWQRHCQERWLTAVRPRLVAWPWENHAWERALVRAARRRGIATIGYQHSVVGSRMLNYGAGSNPDGLDSIPDRVLCSGASTCEQLALWGVPGSSLAISGALRFVDPTSVPHDPMAPVFIALPFDWAVAEEMVSAAIAAARRGWRFVIKPHPMMPYPVKPSDGIAVTNELLQRQPAVSQVVFAATSVGLEAALMGLPVLRFRPARRLSIDVFPAGIVAPVTEAGRLAEDLQRSVLPLPLQRSNIFAPVDHDLWRGIFAGPPAPYRSTAAMHRVSRGASSASTNACIL